MRTEVTTAIAAPAERVWQVLADVERWPSWTASVTSVAIDGPLAVGAVATIRQPKLPRTRWTVTEVVPGRSFTWQAVAPGSRAVGEHEITSTGEGSCDVRVSLEQRGPLGALVGWLYRNLTRRYVEMEAAGLAARAVASPSR